MEFSEEILRKAEWLIDHGYMEGDILEVARVINKQVKGAATPSTLNTETTGDSNDV